jgi:hypothetical protein
MGLSVLVRRQVTGRATISHISSIKKQWIHTLPDNHSFWPVLAANEFSPVFEYFDNPLSLAYALAYAKLKVVMYAI